MADLTRIIPSPEAKEWQRKNDILQETLASGNNQFRFSSEHGVKDWDEEEQAWLQKP